MNYKTCGKCYNCFANDIHHTGYRSCSNSIKLGIPEPPQNKPMSPSLAVSGVVVMSVVGFILGFGFAHIAYKLVEYYHG